MARDVGAYLADQQRKSIASGNSDLSQSWTEMEELYNKKYSIFLFKSVKVSLFAEFCPMTQPFASIIAQNLY